MLCDSARSNVYEDVVYEKNVRTSIRVLEQNDPVWRNKQTVEHTGSVNLTAGLMSKDGLHQPVQRSSCRWQHPRCAPSRH
jgi:hypothetical protein